ncbi:heterokaryon incompatibility protein-domain-containing protein [Lophiotrema nucula]|uniref:Heterokaryon incompatibility protein-domain-containing protein n=1 Tax=Lophiotrema nucula TaxID=690887 RepID=A0A6A5Z757_9PLEO|nr:heterokaryon incompatibility protein-domain-containing protein [Lophiotrema nucula]
MASIHSQLSSLDSIRLLHILPGADNADIQAELNVYEAGDVPAYEALSYCWGAPEPSQEIQVNAKPFSVGPNLFTALRKLRRREFKLSEHHGHQPSDDDLTRYTFVRRRNAQPSSVEDQVRIVWVDAICLNQKDATEKAHQVKRMFDIFSRARLVVIWWGDQELDVVKAFPILAAATEEWQRSPKIDREMLRLRQTSAPPGYPSYNDQAWTAFLKLLDKDWCDRVWIIQEAAASSSATVVLGDLEIDWNTLSAAVYWIFESIKRGPYIVMDDTPQKVRLRQALRLLNVSTIYRSGHLNHERLMYWTLITMIQGFQSTLQVDRVYSLLGLLPKLHIEPSYEVPEIQPFRIATRQLLEIESSLGPLGLVDHRQDFAPEATSTWVSIWSNPQVLRYYLNYPSHLVIEPFSASGPYQMILLPISDPTSLRLAGNVVEGISLFSDVMPEHQDLPEYAYSLWVEPINKFFSSEAVEVCQFQGFGDSFSAIINVLTVGRIYWNTRHGMETDHVDAALAFTNLVRRGMNTFNLSSHAVYLLEDFKSVTVGACAGRRIFLTESGFLGLGPRILRAGDQVAVFAGGNTPFVIRRITRPQAEAGDDGTANQRYQFIGECYVHGLMRGELAARWADGTLKMEEIELV